MESIIGEIDALLKLEINKYFNEFDFLQRKQELLKLLRLGMKSDCLSTENFTVYKKWNSDNEEDFKLILRRKNGLKKI